jgi:hypothetical protein
MPRYFLDLYSDTETVLDTEGAVFVSADEMMAAALNGAREIIAADAMSGVVDLSPRIDVRDEGDQVIHTLHFADAVAFLSEVQGSARAA